MRKRVFTVWTDSLFMDSVSYGCVGTDAVRNLIQKVGVPFESAVDAATYNPACNIGLEDEIGSIALGKRADFTVVNSNFDVLATIVDGNVVYKKSR